MTERRELACPFVYAKGANVAALFSVHGYMAATLCIMLRRFACGVPKRTIMQARCLRGKPRSGWNSILIGCPGRYSTRSRPANYSELGDRVSGLHPATPILAGS
jgi:hypothetical protein